VIGTVILFGFLILALSLYQVQVVPQENAQVEFQHFEDVQNDLVELRNAISSAGQSERPQFVGVKLGTNYQNRLFTINPPDPAGTLRTSPAYNITITDDYNTTENVSTRFVEYRPGYNELRTGSIWYENSVLYLSERESDNRAVIIEDQNLVTDNDTLRITALQNDFRASGTRRVALELYPANDATNLSRLEGELNVSIPTRLGEEDGYWNESIESGSVTYLGVDDDRYSNGVSALRLRVDSPGDITVNSVGIQSEPSEGAVRDNIGLVGGGGDGGDGSDGGDGGDGGDGSDTLPAGAVAYDDANNNEMYDTGEATYTGSDLQSFDQPVDLVVARDVSETAYDIQANSITIDPAVTMSAQNGEIGLGSPGQIRVSGTLDTTRINGNGISLDGGSVDLTDGTLRASSSVQLSSQGRTSLDRSVIDTTAVNGAGVSISSSSDLSVADAEIVSGGSITLSGSDRISGDDALFDTTQVNSNSITVSASTDVQIGDSDFLSGGSISVTGNGGAVDLAGSVLDATQVNGNSITLESNGNMILDRASLRINGSGSLTGSLNRGREELFVQDAEFLRDGSGTEFDYSPNGVSVTGTPARGTTG
jgi:hypothetical protein